MYDRVRAFVVVLLALAFVHRANAAVSVFLAPVPISPAAVAADPVLAGFQTWDLRVVIPSGSNWEGAGIRAQLSTGTFYNSPLGGNGPFANLWPTFPQLRYDTFVTDAADPNVDATFEFPNIYSVWPEEPIPAQFLPTLTSAAFAPIFPDSGPGTFTIARLTFSHNASGMMNGIVYSTETPIGLTYSFPIPEPSGALLAVAALFALLRKRSY
jgi:hypothetical protein